MKAVKSAGSIKEKAYFAFTLILKRLERLVPEAGHKETRRNKYMIEIATVRNELDRTSGKLKDFRGSL